MYNGKEVKVQSSAKKLPKPKDVIVDPMGQWKHPGQVTKIPGNIMATHGYGNIPLWVVPDNDPARLVMPNSGQQIFPNSTNFIEYPQLPIAQKGYNKVPNIEYVKGIGSQYDPVMETVYIDTNDPEDPKKLLNHELWHHYQNYNNYLRLPEDFPTAKRPQTPASDQMLQDYYNRKLNDVNILSEGFRQRYPEFNMVPDDLLYDRAINDIQYQQPWTLEGEGRAAETPRGKEFLKNQGYDVTWLDSVLDQSNKKHGGGLKRGKSKRTTSNPYSGINDLMTRNELFYKDHHARYVPKLQSGGWLDKYGSTEGYNSDIEYMGDKYKDVGVSYTGPKGNLNLNIGNTIPTKTSYTEKATLFNPYAEMNYTKGNSTYGVQAWPGYVGGKFTYNFAEGGEYQTGGSKKYTKPDYSNNLALPNQYYNPGETTQSQGREQADAIKGAMFKKQQYEDMAKLDEEKFRKKYDSSKHAVRYEDDPNYRAKVDAVAQNATSKVFATPMVDPNAMFMLPTGLSGQGAADYQNFHKDIIGSALPVPGLEAVGKLPSVFDVINASKESGILSNAYKLNPFAEKLANPNKSYRVAGMDSAKDFETTGVLRSNPPIITANISEGIAGTRTTPFPSFQKGYADLRYLPEEGGVIFETDLPTFKRGEINPVTGNKIRGSHYAHRVIDPTTGKVLREIPSENVRMFESKPDWLRGYKEIPKRITEAASPQQAGFTWKFNPLSYLGVEFPEGHYRKMGSGKGIESMIENKGIVSPSNNYLFYGYGNGPMEDYPGVYAVGQNPLASNSVIKKWTKFHGPRGMHSGRTPLDINGEEITNVPLSDPGLTVYRRFPFSNAYTTVPTSALLEGPSNLREKILINPTLANFQKYGEDAFKLGLYGSLGQYTFNEIYGDKKDPTPAGKPILQYIYEKTVGSDPSTFLQKKQTGGPKVGSSPYQDEGSKMSQHDWADYQNQLAYEKSMAQAKQDYINDYVKKGHALVVNNPAFKAAAYATPVGAAIGAIEGAANVAPDLYNKNYVNAAIDVAAMLPVVSSFRSTKAFKPIEVPESASVSSHNLEELRKIYHNNERFLEPEESAFLHKHGHGLRENYYNSNRGNQGIEGYDIFRVNNQLPAPPSEIEFMPDGTTRAVYNQNPTGWQYLDYQKPKLTNRSGLTKEETLVKASAKDKDVISKMSEDEFKSTVIKPTGEVVSYKHGPDIKQMEYNPNLKNMQLSGTIPMTHEEYSNAFNERLDLLNDIISEKNKSGLEYRVKELTPSGQLVFETPSMPGAERIWQTEINPGQWRGEVEDIANKEYYKSIPGLNMVNSASGVFGDLRPRRGTRTYEAINEYLKRLDLGRVKPGFNSQSIYSKPLWENQIKKGNAFGFYGDPNTVYGTLRKNGGKTGGWLDSYR